MDRSWLFLGVWGIGLLFLGFSPDLQAAPGDKKWEFVFGSEDVVDSCPAIGSDGTVYFGSGDKKVYAVNGQTGMQKWVFLTGGEVHRSPSPAVGADGTVYVGSYDAKVYALDGQTGAKKWEFVTGIWVDSSPAIGADGTVYVGSDKMYALDGQTGAKKWEFSIGSIGTRDFARVSTPPAIGADGTVYFGSDYNDRKVYALDGKSGAKKWRSELADGSTLYGSLALGAGGTVYFVADNKVGAFDALTGIEKWESITGWLRSPYCSYPAIGADGTVYFGSYEEGKLFAFDSQTGAKKFQFDLGGELPSSSTLAADGTIYVRLGSQTIRALDGQTGVRKWEFVSETLLYSSPALGEDGTLFVGSRGRLYALAGSAGLAKSPWPKFQGDAGNTGSHQAIGSPVIRELAPSTWWAQGSTNSLWILAGGSGLLSYQWYFNGHAIEGAKTATFVVPNVAGSQDGNYQAVVGNAFGSVTSAVIRVQVGYGVEVTVEGQGEVLFSPKQAAYPAGTLLTLTATGRDGRPFREWTGDVGSLENTLTVVVDRPLRIRARFELPLGSKKWEFVFGSEDVVDSCPAIGSDGTVYFGSGDKKVYALNGQTGMQKWVFLTGGKVRCSPAVGADGTVYVGSYDMKVYALDGQTGAKKWEFVTGDWVDSSPAIGADGTVYVGSDKMYALDGQTGAKKWEFSIGSIGTRDFAPVSTSPAIGADGTVYFGSDSSDRKVYALDGKSGAKKWRSEFLDGSEVYGSLALGADGTVYFVADNKVGAFDALTGIVKWESITGRLNASYYSYPAIGADGTVYFGSDEGRLFALDGQTGAKKFQFDLGGEFPSSSTLAADGTIYVRLGSRTIRALDGQTGVRKWEFVSATLLYSSPALGEDGTLFVGSRGRLFALAGSVGLAKSPWPKFQGDAGNTGSHQAIGSPVIRELAPSTWWAQGSTNSFWILAGGSGLLSYQWYFNGYAIEGAKTATFVVPNVAGSQDGNYQAVVGNAFGSVTSAVIRVQVGCGVEVSVEGEGEVLYSPKQAAYPAGTVLTLTATGRDGRPFREWTGDVGSLENTLTVVVDRPLRIRARFELPLGSKKWEFVTGQTLEMSSPAIGADGTVYVASGEKTYALDGQTGAMKWEFRTSSGMWGSGAFSPTLGVDGTVYVGSLDGRVYALDGQTGVKQWEFDAAGWVHAPALGADGTVYIGPRGGIVYALDGQTGTKKWKFVTGSDSDSMLAVGADRTVYVGSPGEQVYQGGHWIQRGKFLALDGETGVKKWEFVAEPEVYVVYYSPPALGPDGTVYVGSRDMYALDGFTGAKKWEFGTEPNYYSPQALGPDGTVYVGAVGGAYALDGQTGAKKWEFVMEGASCESSPAIGADGTAYVWSDSKMCALDGQTGAKNKKWEFVTGCSQRSSPAIGADGTVYVGSYDGKVYALEGSAGLANSAWPKFMGNARNSGLAYAQRALPKIIGIQGPGNYRIGTRVTLKSELIGQSPFSLQWLLNDQTITGATNPVYTIPALGPAEVGRYSFVLSNAWAETNSDPVIVAMRNVNTALMPGLVLQAPVNTALQIQSTPRLGPEISWQPLTNLTVPTRPYVFMDVTAHGVLSRFYRTTQPDRLELRWYSGWIYTNAVGSRHRIEYVTAETGLTNWLFLTELTLPESPYWFFDFTATNGVARYYWSTPLP